jgi:hypothetical protein
MTKFYGHKHDKEIKLLLKKHELKNATESDYHRLADLIDIQKRYTIKKHKLKAMS